MKSIIVSDLDLTLTRASLMYELSAHHVKKGIMPPEALDRGMAIINRYSRAEISYHRASLEALEIWASSLKGQPLSGLAAGAREFFGARPDMFYPYFPELRARFRASHDFYLVTANFDFVAGAICEIFGLDGYAATLLGSDGGVCDGSIKKSLLADGQKEKETKKLLENYDSSRSIGLGDTENDVGLLKEVACPICVNPNPRLRQIAAENSWSLADPENVLEVIDRASAKKIFNGII